MLAQVYLSACQSFCTDVLVYLHVQDTQIHWFSIVNSVVVVFFLSGIITMIIIRTLRRDIAKYNMADDDIEESIEETGDQIINFDLLLVSFCWISLNHLCVKEYAFCLSCQKIIELPQDGSWFTEMSSVLLSTIDFLLQSLGLGFRWLFIF